MSCSEEYIVIKFDDHGEKKFVLAIALAALHQDLLVVDLHLHIGSSFVGQRVGIRLCVYLAGGTGAPGGGVGVFGRGGKRSYSEETP